MIFENALLFVGESCIGCRRSSLAQVEKEEKKEEWVRFFEFSISSSEEHHLSLLHQFRSELFVACTVSEPKYLL